MLNNTGNEVAGSIADFDFNIVKALNSQPIDIDGQKHKLIDAVGKQFHVNALNPPSYDAVYKEVKRLLDIGVDVRITELDIDLGGINSGNPDRLQLQSRIFGDIISAYLEAYQDVKGNFDGSSISVFGIADGVNWLQFINGPNSDASPLYDESYKEKPGVKKLEETLTSYIF